MTLHSTPPDDVAEHLRQWRIPAPGEDAISRIVAHAQQHPRSGFAWLGWLRQLRALIYVPKMRYAIMASLVGFFIVVGALSPDAPRSTSGRAELLSVITFDEEDPLKPSQLMAGL